MMEGSHQLIWRWLKRPIQGLYVWLQTQQTVPEEGMDPGDAASQIFPFVSLIKFSGNDLLLFLKSGNINKFPVMRDDEWWIITIFKKGHRLNCSNYHRIELLPIAGERELYFCYAYRFQLVFYQDYMLCFSSSAQWLSRPLLKLVDLPSSPQWGAVQWLWWYYLQH